MKQRPEKKPKCKPASEGGAGGLTQTSPALGFRTKDRGTRGRGSGLGWRLRVGEDAARAPRQVGRRGYWEVAEVGLGHTGLPEKVGGGNSLEGTAEGQHREPHVPRAAGEGPRRT